MCPQAAYLDGEGSSCPRRDMMLINVLIPEKQIPPGGEVRGRDRLSGQDMAREAKVTHPSSSCTCGGPSCLRTSAGGCRSWRGSCGRDRDSCRSWGGDWGESWRAGGEKEGVVQHFSTSFRKLSRHSRHLISVQAGWSRALIYCPTWVVFPALNKSLLLGGVLSDGQSTEPSCTGR